ncbi:MAG: hypothetical protein DRN83_01210 [Hadesarchaea archaeon]|nr:MAG: hypothetical protein DRN83_01210 [Hadesarchaea archaeon]
MSYRIAVIGDLSTSTGMALAGVSYTHVHKSREETLEKLRKFLEDESIGLVLLTYRIAEELEPEFGQLMRGKGMLPVVLKIPDKTGYMPSIDELSEVIRRTVGTEVTIKGEMR